MIFFSIQFQRKTAITPSYITRKPLLPKDKAKLLTLNKKNEKITRLMQAAPFLIASDKGLNIPKKERNVNQHPTQSCHENAKQINSGSLILNKGKSSCRGNPLSQPVITMRQVPSSRKEFRPDGSVYRLIDQ